MRALELFCGAGGASNAIRDFGFESTGYDFWGDACMTQIANGHDAVLADLDTHVWQDEQVDFIWASPPCQPFTRGGKKLGKYDDRDGMPAFLRALETLKPPVFIMENVKGLIVDRALGLYLQENMTALRNLGYKIEYRVLDAANYGVPQRRERIFVVGQLDPQKIHWPKPTTPEWITMAEAMGWPDTDMVGFPRKYDGKGEEYFGYRKRDLVPTSQPSHTITTKVRSWSRWQVDGTCLRITVEDAAKIQDFPADYEFMGSNTSCYTQIANAVPYTLTKVVLEAVFGENKQQ